MPKVYEEPLEDMVWIQITRENIINDKLKNKEKLNKDELEYYNAVMKKGDDMIGKIKRYKETGEFE